MAKDLQSTSVRVELPANKSDVREMFAETSKSLISELRRICTDLGENKEFINYLNGYTNNLSVSGRAEIDIAFAAKIAHDYAIECGRYPLVEEADVATIKTSLKGLRNRSYAKKLNEMAHAAE